MEFALILPFLIILLLFLLDLGRAVLDYSILNTAVREGTRSAIIQCNGGDKGVARATTVLTNDHLAGYSFLPNPSVVGSSKTGGTVTLSIKYQFKPVLINFLSFDLKVQSTMFLVPSPDAACNLQ